jgi:hypothetical protein
VTRFAGLQVCRLPILQNTVRQVCRFAASPLLGGACKAESQQGHAKKRKPTMVHAKPTAQNSTETAQARLSWLGACGGKGQSDGFDFGAIAGERGTPTPPLWVLPPCFSVPSPLAGVPRKQ